MNYQKIYTAFIADRRTTEDAAVLLSSYLEKHHIVPRSLGGDDTPGNLIRLTPEDHFFAHLLLAKIHGGKLWVPLKLMVAGHARLYGEARRQHGFAARRAAEAFSGENCPNFKHDIYDLVHADGRAITLRRGDMPAKLGMTGTDAYRLTAGHISRSRGWSLAGSTVKTSRGRKGAVHDFVNVDGRAFSGTQMEFHKHSGMSRNAIAIIQKGATSRGWHLRGTTPIAPKGPNTGKGAVLRFAKDGQTVEGKRLEVAEAMGTTPKEISDMLVYLRGRPGRCWKGWTLHA